MLLTRKSSKSNTDEPAPKGWNPESTLKPSTHGIDNTKIRMQLMKQAFFLDHLNKSMHQEMMFSNTAITVEKEANVMKMKNKLPQTLPIDMLLKMFGNVMKIKLGPLFASMPYAKHAGKIIRPAVKATNVSKIETLTASPISERSFPM